MTVAALIKIGLVVYGLLLGAAVLYLRWHPESASRVVFEWRARSGVVAGELIGSQGASDTQRLAYRSVELLGEAFGERMSAIAGETGRAYEALTAREFVRLQEEELSRFARRLGEIDRRVTQIDAEVAQTLAEASTPEPITAPSPSEPSSTEPPLAPEPWFTGSPHQADTGAVVAEQDPAVAAAREAWATARYRLDLARQRLIAREQEFLVLRRRSYVREHLRLAARLVPESDGVALELAVENDGDLAALRLTVVIAVGETPLVIDNGRVKPAETGGASRVLPRIVNEFGEIIRGLPPQFRWEARFPYEGADEDTLLARARDSATGRTRFVAGIADADLAPMERLRPTTPAEAGERVWTYPETSLEELFRDDLAAARVGFTEAGDVAQAERALARARRDLAAAERAAVERALWARRLDAWPKGGAAGGPFVVPPAPPAPPPPSSFQSPSPTPEAMAIVAGTQVRARATACGAGRDRPAARPVAGRGGTRFRAASRTGPAQPRSRGAGAPQLGTAREDRGGEGDVAQGGDAHRSFGRLSLRRSAAGDLLRLWPLATPRRWRCAFPAEGGGRS